MDGLDMLGCDDALGVEWGDVGRGAAGAGHVTGKVLLNLFAGGAGTQQVEQLMQSQDILPSWAEGAPSFAYASPDLVGVAFKDGRRESFKAPKKVAGYGGKVVPGNGYVTGDNPGEKFTAALEVPAKVVVDDKTLLDVAFVFVHGGASQTQTKVGHMEGLDILGADPVVIIPKAGANYTDAKTVTAVQYALMKRGYDLGDYGPNRDGVDGLFGSKTKKAIEQMQRDAGLLVTGTINEDVIMALKVTPGVLPPGVTVQQVAAFQAEVALQAATKAEHAKTPAEVQQAAQETADLANTAQPPLPPEVRQAAMDALERSKKVTTPAEAQQVKREVQQAAQSVAVAAAPSWWTSPAWVGGPERWKVTLAALGGTAALGGVLVWLLSGSTTAAGGGMFAGLAAKKRASR